MKKNEEYTVVCEDLTDQGYGVSHIDGFTVFVSSLLPEEKAKIRIIKPFKKYAIARVEERYTSSPQRVEPKCPQAGKCGGCAFLSLSYPAQLEYKQKQLQKIFSDVDPDIQVLPVLGMEEPYHYRNKAQFPIQVKDGKIISGFYKSRTNDIVDLEECAIQSEEINRIFLWIKKNLSLDIARHLRHIFIRASKGTGEVQVVFIGRQNNGLKDFAKKLKEKFPEIQSIVFNKNTRDDNVILGDEYEVLEGRDYIYEDCLGLKVKLHFKSFFQVNPDQTEVLYSKALEMADLKPEDSVIELYAGTGTIGMLASRRAGKVTGVEIVEDAVKNARENLAINDIHNAEYICMDATKFAAENKEKADVVIVDPPRKGMSSQGIEDIATLNPRKIVYISCNPRTLARDLDDFKKHGYRAKEIQPVDMFAHSANVECVTVLTKEQ